MKKLLTNQYFLFLLRLVIGGTFIYSAVDKILYPDEFARIVYNYHLLPGQTINLFALLLPWVELVAGVLLIAGFWEKAAAVVIGGLLAVFIVALGNALIKGVNIECGCFSTTSRAKGPVQSLIVRDILMLIGCGLIFWARKSWLSIDGRKVAA